ncbi:glycosyltransferase family 4 protein [Weizmannia agrestimuris]|uniref:glycosyltransferase family 4 protein n=1 Tax=Weizmannia agrestimuris TaxID=2941342 RepID=UPI0020421086|nr:glycosyltransferase family 1 protein [Weizmannia agrestimuris]
MKSHITIDTRMINASGIGTYIKNVLPLVINELDGIDFTLMGNLSEINFIHGKVNKVEFTAPIYSPAEQLISLKKIPKKTSLLWVPHINIPILYSGKMLVTVHDVFHIANPEYVKGFHKKLYANLLYRAVRNHADAIICVSEFTKDEFTRLLNHQKNNIYKIHNGMDQTWKNSKIHQRLHEKPYFLAVGNVKPHKNLKNLLKAYEQIMDRIPHDLVIIGKKDGFRTGDNEILKMAEPLGDRVHFTGFVSEEGLKSYYKHAEALVFTSFYEGFGLPPLEAMALGCPVISSNAASLPEVCGEAALYVDPYNPEDIAGKMKNLIYDKKIRKQLIEKGLSRINHFSWQQSAKETSLVIERVLEK